MSDKRSDQQSGASGYVIIHEGVGDGSGTPKVCCFGGGNGTNAMEKIIVKNTHAIFEIGANSGDAPALT